MFKKWTFLPIIAALLLMVGAVIWDGFDTSDSSSFWSEQVDISSNEESLTSVDTSNELMTRVDDVSIEASEVPSRLEMSDSTGYNPSATELSSSLSGITMMNRKTANIEQAIDESN